ncbi:hypothetical protein DE146DRAFT_627264 [Phaeosphaeria sp. MPI-PUGE-AT-0046c]|nr:hypothetical protein DE146DRAFT_627264 [Phaeosphaeria sp. MPI-PUGE-AT-0046c]
MASHACHGGRRRRDGRRRDDENGADPHAEAYNMSRLDLLYIPVGAPDRSSGPGAGDSEDSFVASSEAQNHWTDNSYGNNWQLHSPVENLAFHALSPLEHGLGTTFARTEAYGPGIIVSRDISPGHGTKPAFDFADEQLLHQSGQQLMDNSMQFSNDQPSTWLPLSSAPTQSPGRHRNASSDQTASNIETDMSRQYLGGIAYPTYCPSYDTNPGQHTFDHQLPWSVGNRRFDRSDGFPKDDVVYTAAHEACSDTSRSRGARSAMSHTDQHDRTTSASSFRDDVDSASSLRGLEQSFETICPGTLNSMEEESRSLVGDLGQDRGQQHGSSSVEFRYSVREAIREVAIIPRHLQRPLHPILKEDRQQVVPNVPPCARYYTAQKQTATAVLLADTAEEISIVIDECITSLEGRPTSCVRFQIAIAFSRDKILG